MLQEQPILRQPKANEQPLSLRHGDLRRLWRALRDFVNQLATFALWTPANVCRTAQRAVLDALLLGKIQMLTDELITWLYRMAVVTRAGTSGRSTSKSRGQYARPI